MPRLPIFPLQIVVFPGEEVPLHIFEPRYRQLVRDMNDSGEPFGIALLRRGAQAEETHEIGCTVRIEQTEPFPDGRFNVMCRGEQRFRIIQRLDAAPYWIADVEFLDDPGDSESDDAYAACTETAELYRQHLRMALALQNSWQRRFPSPCPPDPPDQPHRLASRSAPIGQAGSTQGRHRRRTTPPPRPACSAPPTTNSPTASDSTNANAGPASASPTKHPDPNAPPEGELSRSD